ncbi:MAG: hypothetical protein ACR2NN_29450 [Bryobacteraceae bacterium]
MHAVILVYLGFIIAFLGGASIIKPLSFLWIHSRFYGMVFLGLGLLISFAGMELPAKEVRVAVLRTKLDEFAPEYQFNELHSIRVAASRDRVYAAIQTVTAREILFFRTLTWIRRFGRPGPESILNAPEHLPILEVARQSGFLQLAEELGREIVLGTPVLAPRGWRPKKEPTPEEFKAVDAPGFAMATINFLVEEDNTGACRVTTETRVHATDPGARRHFARYWRVIYPGSSLIRLMWLRAIKKRAEAAVL